MVSDAISFFELLDRLEEEIGSDLIDKEDLCEAREQGEGGITAPALVHRCQHYVDLQLKGECVITACSTSNDWRE